MLIWTVFILISINSPILIVNGFLNAIYVEDALAVGELFDRLRSRFALLRVKTNQCRLWPESGDEFGIASVPIDEFGVASK
jgi:hypothetical protein